MNISHFFFCILPRKETKELKSQLVSYGMKKSQAEGLYAQAQETAAK